MIRKFGNLVIDATSTGEGRREADTSTCSHCQRIVILDPRRERPRSYCRKCDHYICDECGAVAWASVDHTPFEKKYDQAVSRVERGLPSGSLLV